MCDIAQFFSKPYLILSIFFQMLGEGILYLISFLKVYVKNNDKNFDKKI